MTTIAVTSPTGKIGSAVCRLAAERGVAIRALARTPSRVSGATTTAVAFDFSEPTTYGPALSGIEVLILIAPSTPQQADEEIAVIEAGRAAGVEHIVKLSVTGAEPGGLTFTNLHKRVERYCKAESIPYTFLRPTFFMQNALGLRDAIAQGTYPSPMSAEKIGQISADDIAAVALAAALDPAAHQGKIYELTGPAALTGDEIAAALTTATGKPVQYIAISDDEFRAAMQSAGADDWTINGLLELYKAVRAGHTKRITTDVQTVTGRAPVSFIDWATSAFTPVAP